ncbi:MAG: TonB-dependent receptor [Bacteroidia bacterium]
MSSTRYYLILLGWLLWYSLGVSLPTLAQSVGNVSGVVRDASSGDPLVGATVKILSLNRGAVTNIDGEFVLAALPAGKHNLVAAYIGYKSQTLAVEVQPGQSVFAVFLLLSDAVSLDSVVISAQVSGQLGAINNQISSNTIVNVVSRDRILSLPDQNAAEAIGRISGVSVQRENGEGQKVVVRGLSPKFNSITINGERIPSTDGADRSVDLSMIAPEALGGIEVFKSLTPDRDADAIGGSVNFVAAKARSGWKAGLNLQGGYNDQQQRWGLPRGSFLVSNRFLKDKLGLVVGGNYQLADRSSDRLSADYELAGTTSTGEAVVRVTNISLSDRLETRVRYGGSLTADYRLPHGSIMLNGLWGQTERDEVRRRRNYRVDDNYQDLDINLREVGITLFSANLSGEHRPGGGKLGIAWRVSAAQSLQNDQFNLRMRFREFNAFENTLVRDQGPEIVPTFAKNNVERTGLQDAFFDRNRIVERNATGQFDLTYPLRIGTLVTGQIKAGGKVRANERDRDIESLYMPPLIVRDSLVRVNPRPYELGADGRVNVAQFTGEEAAEDFLEGAYFIGMGSDSLNAPLLDPARLRDLYERYFHLYLPDQRQDIESYRAEEVIWAGYAMAEINIGTRLMILGGLRGEDTRLNYTATTGDLVKEDYSSWYILNARDTSRSRSYLELFPMLHLRYKFAKWTDVRLAVTRTLARPNYADLAPWQRINDDDLEVARGNPDLAHSPAWNYDVFWSIYNKWGLFTVGAFHKAIQDVNYLAVIRVLDNGPTRGYELTEPRSAEGTSTVSGLELDLQTNLRLLPSPLDGIVLGANVTLLRSRTFYPLFERIGTQPEPPFEPIFALIEREGNMPQQPDLLYNVSLGYEKGPFSGRASVVYQGNSLFSLGNRAEGDQYTIETLRLDVAATMRVHKRLKLFLNFNNLTNQPEQALFNQNLSNQEYFGFTADLGLRFSL